MLAVVFMEKIMTSETLHIIGGGLAGCEAAWQAAQRGVTVIIHEMKPLKFSDAHKNENLAELVCSNSLRSDDTLHNAVGLLHQELRLANSLILSCADETKVPAGGALAVDRNDDVACFQTCIGCRTVLFRKCPRIPAWMCGCSSCATS